MNIPESMRKELIKTVENPKNKTGSATIFVGSFIDNEKSKEYKFGIICQRVKKD